MGITSQIADQVGWQVFEDSSVPLSKKLDGWFHVRMSARGESLSMYIDHVLVFRQDSFLKLATGNAGFRNAGPEQALVRKVRVALDA
jgi:hypothetical protein